MVLPLGLIGPIVLDVMAILGTSPHGLPVDLILSKYEYDLHLKMVFDERAHEVL